MRNLDYPPRKSGLFGVVNVIQNLGYPLGRRPFWKGLEAGDPIPFRELAPYLNVTYQPICPWNV